MKFQFISDASVKMIGYDDVIIMKSFAMYTQYLYQSLRTTRKVLKRHFFFHESRLKPLFFPFRIGKFRKSISQWKEDGNIILWTRMNQATML